MSEQQQYPTREQIAEAIASHLVGIRSGDPDVVRAADAVLALSPQPAPNAEPSGPIHSGTCPQCRHAAHADWCPNMASDNDCSCTHDSNASPPSIADMAPGTTFTATKYPMFKSPVPRRLMIVNTYGGKRLVDSEADFWSADSIDPSTIRDVTPPESPNAQ